MGPLFQLVFFTIAYSILAIVAGVVLYVLFRCAAFIWNGNVAAAKQGFWLPLKLGPYFLLALIVTVFVCEIFRDVTPPITDYWSFQLDGSTTMGAIDTLESWTIWPSPDGGEGIVSNVKLFDSDQDKVYGITKENAFFIYRMGLEKKLINLSEEEFDIQLTKNGLSRSNLKTPTDYYYEQRYVGDLVTLLVVLIYPLFRLYKVVRLFLENRDANNINDNVAKNT